MWATRLVMEVLHLWRFRRSRTLAPREIRADRKTVVHWGDTTETRVPLTESSRWTDSATSNRSLRNGPGGATHALKPYFSAALLALLAPCCGSEDISGGGTLLASPADITIVSGSEGLFAGIIRGEPHVNLIQVTQERAVVTALEAPSGCTSPVHVEGADVNFDGLNDVLVADSECAGWAAVQQDGKFNTLPWRDVLPELGANHYLYFQDWNGDGEPELAAGNAVWLEGFSRQKGEWQQPFHSTFPGLPSTNVSMSNSIAVAGDIEGNRQLLFLRGNVFSSLPLSPLSGELKSIEHYSQSQLELLKPYYAYDQLQAIDMNDCVGLALAVGFFPSSQEFPRRLVTLKFTPDGLYAAASVKTHFNDVLSVASIYRDGVLFVGVISRSETQFAFQLFRDQDCHLMSVFEQAGVTFHLPDQGPYPSKLVTGEELVVFSTEESLNFTHLEAKWLDSFSLTQGPTGWEMRNDVWQL